MPEHSLSVLYSQPGYYTGGIKYLFLRAPEDALPGLADGAPFTVADDSGECRYEGRVRYWGKLWHSQWWVADFSVLVRAGVYRLEMPGLCPPTEPFRLSGSVLSDCRLETVALDQLDERLLSGVPGWRDCGTEIRELSSMAITVHAMADLLENPSLLPDRRKRIVNNLIRGAEYIAMSQETWEDPLLDGRFNHDIARQTDYGTSDYHNWHDTAYAISALVRAYEAVKLDYSLYATDFLACATRGYENAIRRPYHLDSDFAGRMRPAGGYNDDFAAIVHETARVLYNKPDGWTLPRSLRAKDILTFTWACTLLYRATGDNKYLNTAVDFADQACDRQCRDARRYEGKGLGFFYEFEGDDGAFMLEWGHNHKFHMGNIEPCNLAGLMELVRLMPRSHKAAKWLNTLHAYIDYHVKASAALTPLRIYPQTVYTDPMHGGVKFFQVIGHGATALYGQIAKNLLELGAFTEDASLQQLAECNLFFPVGHNPGFPEAYHTTSWSCTSLIKGVGFHSFGGAHDLSAVPDGSAMNGFSASPQFFPERIDSAEDAPAGILKPDNTYYFNEDYLPHSHGYVCGVAKIESPCSILVKTFCGGRPVPASVRICWDDGSFYEGKADKDGQMVSNKLPIAQTGEIRASFQGTIIVLPLQTVSGAQLVKTIDFANYLEMRLELAAVLPASQTMNAPLTLKNCGTATIAAHISLAADGVELLHANLSAVLEPGETLIHQVKVITPEKPISFMICALPNEDGLKPDVLAKGLVK